MRRGMGASTEKQDLTQVGADNMTNMGASVGAICRRNVPSCGMSACSKERLNFGAKCCCGMAQCGNAALRNARRQIGNLCRRKVLFPRIRARNKEQAHCFAKVRHATKQGNRYSAIEEFAQKHGALRRRLGENSFDPLRECAFESISDFGKLRFVFDIELRQNVRVKLIVGDFSVLIVSQHV